MVHKRPLLEVLGSLTAAAALLVSASSAYAQGYSTSFDNLTKNLTLSGQDGWTTNDEDTGLTTSAASGSESIGQSDYVGVIGGYSATPPPATPVTDYLGALGGLFQGSTVPGAATVFLGRPFTLGATTTYAFNVDMAIERSQTPYLNNDDFNWTFRNNLGNTVFSIDFVHQTAQASAAAASTYAIRYTVPGLGGTQTSTGLGLLSDSLYHLTVNVNVLTNSFSFAVTQGATNVSASNVSLLTNIGASVTQVAATWDILNGPTDNGGFVAAGSNTLVFNNYAVTIPEPSTWVFAGTGALLLMLTVRRRMRA